MRREFRVRYKRLDGSYSSVETSGEEMDTAKAQRQVEDYLEASGVIHLGIDDVNEVCSTCGGSGKVHSHNPTCWDCNGTGVIGSAP